MNASGSNLTWHAGDVTEEARAKLNGHLGAAIWLTGLSGSGKSTIARALELRLVERGVHAYVVDGDNLRHGLNADLGFGDAARDENIRRASHVTRLLADAGLVVIAAFISPFAAMRNQARALFPVGAFFEVHVATPLAECEARDPKGLYRKVRAGQIANFTGIDSPYEPPTHPELTLGLEPASIEAQVDALCEMLQRAGTIPAR